MSTPAFNLFTDGSCDPNPGPAGWGSVIVPVLAPDLSMQELSGSFVMSTISRMELYPVIKGLEALEQVSIVNVYTDSRYVRDMFEKGWLDRWLRNGWRTAIGDPVKNRDLIEEIHHLRQRHRVRIHWVPGHAGVSFNERAHELAVQARVSQVSGRQEDYPYLARLYGEEFVLNDDPDWSIDAGS